MINKFKKVAIAAGLLMGAATASAAGQTFTVDTTLDDAGRLFNGSIIADDVAVVDTFNADKMSASFTESVTFFADGTFTADIFVSLTAWLFDGAEVNSTGLGSNYGLYSNLSVTGSFTGTGNTLNLFGFDGTFDLWLDKQNDSVGTTLSDLNASGGTATAGIADAATASDDVLLATSSNLDGAGIASAAGGGFTVFIDDFLLSADGENFFVAPTPFYELAMSTGDLGTDLSNLDIASVIGVTQYFGEETSVEFVPEPSALAFLGLGIFALGFQARRKAK